MRDKMRMVAEILRHHARKNAHDAFTVLLRGAVNNRPRLSANNRVIRGGYRSTPVISDNPVDNWVIGGNVQLSHTLSSFLLLLFVLSLFFLLFHFLIQHILLSLSYAITPVAKKKPLSARAWSNRKYENAIPRILLHRLHSTYSYGCWTKIPMISCCEL
jgi:hypothetical protein